MSPVEGLQIKLRELVHQLFHLRSLIVLLPPIPVGQVYGLFAFYLDDRLIPNVFEIGCNCGATACEGGHFII